ncbi:MAG: sigma-70 family RNA polymerase sigma factor [Clostridia bacterium]|nr:sigma-70 family RNA polymerase sigma factor [Clostridia bacterium]
MMIPIILTINRDSDRFFVEKLYRQYRKNIYASAFKILKNREDAEDCVHDVIQTVIRHVSAFREATPEGVPKLLAVFTRNTAINIYRKNKKKKDHESMLPFDVDSIRTDDQGQDPLLIAMNEERKQKIVKILTEMDPMYKDVLVLRVQHGMTNREIADILKISENAVSVRLHRARKILLQESEAEYHET